jgi:hypothetical protein
LNNDNLPAKRFVGLATRWWLVVDEAAPDYSTIRLFRSRLKERKKSAACELLFNEVVGLAQESGIQFGSIQVMGSVHVVANGNTDKEDAGVKGGEEAPSTASKDTDGVSEKRPGYHRQDRQVNGVQD